MGVFFTSDTHFGHVFVGSIRGFDNVNEHDETIISNINKVVRPDDTLFILGDIVMGGWRDNAPIVKRLNGAKHCILGNHDRPAPNNSNGYSYSEEFRTLCGFESVSTMARINVNGMGWMLSHYPYDNAPGDAENLNEFDQYRLRDTGRTLLHGHTHSNEQVSVSLAGTKQIHVGLDAWGLKPVSLGTVQNIINQ